MRPNINDYFEIRLLNYTRDSLIYIKWQIVFDYKKNQYRSSSTQNLIEYIN